MITRYKKKQVCRVSLFSRSATLRRIVKAMIKIGVVEVVEEEL